MRTTFLGESFTIGIVTFLMTSRDVISHFRSWFHNSNYIYYKNDMILNGRQAEQFWLWNLRMLKYCKKLYFYTFGQFLAGTRSRVRVFVAAMCEPVLTRGGAISTNRARVKEIPPPARPFGAGGWWFLCLWHHTFRVCRARYRPPIL